MSSDGTEALPHVLEAEAEASSGGRDAFSGAAGQWTPDSATDVAVVPHDAEAHDGGGPVISRDAGEVVVHPLCQIHPDTGRPALVAVPMFAHSVRDAPANRFCRVLRALYVRCRPLNATLLLAGVPRNALAPVCVVSSMQRARVLLAGVPRNTPGGGSQRGREPPAARQAAAHRHRWPGWSSNLPPHLAGGGLGASTTGSRMLAALATTAVLLSASEGRLCWRR